ncbi:protein-lysine N-methyltransferase EEF2KMT [Eucyclogobius newberryi]|uniref:protein-lysine N-methyltransferase EEF2KMT n=1 Tax=Eucyclogobius newberryi TaxID=166745 RepID=UPI003B5A5BF1
MTTPTVSEKERDLKTFRDYFFSMSRLASLPWNFVEEKLVGSKSSEVISQILNETCFHRLCSEFPPSVRYRRLFLSELIKREEASGLDPSDHLYDALAQVIGAAETTLCYKSYFLPGGGAVTLQENVAVISEGTTGLVTWEAALFLAEWALDNQQYFNNRAVLELGSGVGLTGITVCSSCRPSEFIFSDCHPRVLHKLRENIALNKLDRQAVRVEELDWSSVTEERLAAVRADTVIAADVVYDPVVVETLVSLLRRIVASSRADVFVCSAVRNPDTYRGFTEQLEAGGIRLEVLSDPVTRIFPCNTDSHIELIKLHQKIPQ